MVISLAAAVAFGATSAALTAKTPSPPNIIFIMADDLGQEALACYGNDSNKTPHLDRLASGGMKFTRAHSTPLCTPTRVQVMTGKYNNRNYMVFGLLDSREKTFAHYLKDAGYVTAVAGKWQLLGRKKQVERAGGKVGSTPEQAGFDDYCLWQVEELGSRYKNPLITSKTSGTQTYPGAYGPELFQDFAIGFIRKNRERPFFLYYPMVLTHDPFQPTPDSEGYETIPVKGTKDPKYFPDMVTYMDKIVGRIANELKTLGIAENTILIFTGDNGTGRTVTSIVNGEPVQGAKGSTAKHGTNVPLIVSWPGTVRPNQVNENLVDFTDFLPTFLEAAGSTATKDAQLDGISLLPQLQGRPGPVREIVFCYYEPQLYNNRKEVWAHNKTWKLYEDGRFYNIAADPLEQSVVANDDMTSDARKAMAELREFMDQKLTTGAQAGARR